MQAIFVNHCHPDCPHVCGTRAREFANALSRQGHKIVLLTETLRRYDPAPNAAGLAEALQAHDWATPFRLAVPPRRAPVLEALRAGWLPAWARGVLVAYQYLVRGGMVTDWRDASQPYWRPLAQAFQPDFVWGVFGNTDAWAIAQGIAREAGCPWIRDIKDLWTGFIPRVFRAPLAWRFRGAAATTALARSLVEDAVPWLGKAGHVVYSGLPADLVARVPARAADRPFTLVLVGGVYERDSLDRLIAGIGRFAERQPAVHLIYVGSDDDAVRDAVRPLGDRVTVDIRGMRPFREYWDLITGADVNLYVRVRGPAWHHKVVELVAAGRPVLCVPREIDEARDLARHASGRLYEAADPTAVAAALAELYQEGPATVPSIVRSGNVARFTWDALAGSLLEACVCTSAIDKAGAEDYRGAGRSTGERR